MFSFKTVHKYNNTVQKIAAMPLLHLTTLLYMFHINSNKYLWLLNSNCNIPDYLEIRETTKHDLVKSSRKIGNTNVLRVK